MAKKIYTNVKKTAHGRPRRGWGIAWEGFGSVASCLESLVKKGGGEFLDLSLRR
jgi:phytoene dehydrogenase-like protein